MAIEITRFQQIDKGSLVAFFDIYVPKMGIEISHCALLKKHDYWINLPQRTEKDDNGGVKYIPVIRFRNPDHEKSFKKILLDETLKLAKMNPAQIEFPLDQTEDFAPF